MSNFSFLGSFSGTSPGGRVAGRVLDISKIQLTQPSLVELGLRLSLAKTHGTPGVWRLRSVLEDNVGALLGHEL